MTARLLPAGLDRLGAAVGGIVDGLGWADQLSGILPGYSDSTFSLTPVGVFQDPTVVEMEARAYPPASLGSWLRGQDRACGGPIRPLHSWTLDLL